MQSMARVMWISIVAVVAALVCVLPGCGGEAGGGGRDDDTTGALTSGSGWDPEAAMRGEGPNGNNGDSENVLSANGGDGGDGGGWMISLGMFRADEEQAAQQALRAIQQSGTVPGVQLVKRGRKSLMLAYGQYASADGHAAQTDLERIRGIEVDGARPFGAAFLAPPMQGFTVGSMPQYNLLNARGTFGAQAMYTLQIGAYGRRDVVNPTRVQLQEVRKQAEQAVIQLRQEGELAYYYHSPRMSMVTVGVFDGTDWDPQTPMVFSPRLRILLDRYPQNLYNGAAVREKYGNGKTRIQHSTLVAIPKAGSSW